MADGKHADITKRVIGAFYRVYNVLGYGFLEWVYANALAFEMARSGLHVAQEVPLTVYYGQRVVGEYLADLVVEGAVLVELKAVRQLCQDHEAQLLNYLKATEIEVGLLLNFGPRPEVLRRVYDNGRKGALTWLSPAQP